MAQISAASEPAHLRDQSDRESLIERFQAVRAATESLTANLDIRIVAGEEGFRQFQSLHTRMVARKNEAHGDAVDLLPFLAKELPDELAPRTVIASSHGRPVAGAILALHGDTAYYVYGATNEEALPLRAGFALQWWIVRWLSDQGLDWYDLGGTAGDCGLKQFKTGLVGREGSIVEMPGEYDSWNRRSDRMAADALFMLRSLAKAPVVRAFRGCR